jgi:hypothetical protein
MSELMPFHRPSSALTRKVQQQLTQLVAETGLSQARVQSRAEVEAARAGRPGSPGGDRGPDADRARVGRDERRPQDRRLIPVLTGLIILGLLLVVVGVFVWRAPGDEATRVTTEQRMAEWQLQQVSAQGREAMRRAAGGDGP